jgi:hypothetical protein
VTGPELARRLLAFGERNPFSAPAHRAGDRDTAERSGLRGTGARRVQVPIGSHSTSAKDSGTPVPIAYTDAPCCADCGSLMLRTGSCHTCPNCGANDGCG